jgi:hypothetical protein
MWKIPALMGLLLTGTALAAEKGPGVDIVKEWKGSNATQETPTQRVVEDQAGWEEVWRSMKGNAHPKPDIPKIDFTTHTVIAVFMGRRMSGGYAVLITSIEGNDKLVVTVKESGPSRGAMVTMALTSPYHVAVIPKIDKAVEFVTVDPAPGQGIPQAEQ